MLSKLRKICMALPEVVEERMHGHPVFRVKKKPFCIYHGRGGEEAEAIKVAMDLQEPFLKDKRFFKTPHVARYGWISFRDNVRMPAPELKELIVASYRLTAAAKKKPIT